MEWLNYHHLLYFWVVVREGGLVPAGKVLRLAHPTLSGQIKTLEENLGEKLFSRDGRRLVLTDVGRVVFQYADEIFTIGRELLDTVKGRRTGHALRLDVGVADVVPKLIVKRLIMPAYRLPEPIHLVAHEERFELLLEKLALHELDLIITDAPLASGGGVRGFNHLLGESGITFFGHPKLIDPDDPRPFPRCLDDRPVLYPSSGSALRRALDMWLEHQGIRPRIVGEFDDSALLKAFGAEGLGFFVSPTLIADEVERQFGVQRIGDTLDVSERFYAITVSRRIQNPAVLAITGKNAGPSPKSSERRRDVGSARPKER